MPSAEVARNRRVTSLDVAHEAGVSRATVSYVLNDAPNQTIPEATRRKVLDAVEKLGYSPSAAARTLAGGRSQVVLQLMPNLPLNETVGSFLERLSSVLAENGLTLLTHPWSEDAQPLTKLVSAISPVAILVGDPVDDATRTALQQAGVLAVLPTVDGQLFADVQKQIGRMQAEVLVDGGHKDLAVALPDDHRLQNVALLRLEGTAELCAERGLSEPVAAVIPLDTAEAASVLNGWRSAQVPRDGICAHDDATALALLAAAHTLRLAVPQDLAVIGVDNIEAGRVSLPPLTTVYWDRIMIADNTARQVIASLKGLQYDSSLPGNWLNLVRRTSA